MAKETSGVGAGPVFLETAHQDQAVFWYSIYGLHVRSDMPLPIAQAPRPEASAPDIVFRCAQPGQTAPRPDGPAVARTPCPVHAVDETIHRSPRGTWIWNRSTATCYISPDARQVDLYPEDGAEPKALALMLVGQVSIFILHQLGYPSLHASAVTTERGALVFLGPQGRGKSTMAASFLRRGAALLTDDALPMQLQAGGVCGIPSLPIMKVWRQTAEQTMGLPEELPSLVTGFDKRFFSLCGRFAFAPAPAPIRAMYLLERSDPAPANTRSTGLRALSGREALATLIAQTSNYGLLNRTEQSRLLPLYAQLLGQAPLRVLQYPDGFEHQEAVYTLILESLEAP